MSWLSEARQAELKKLSDAEGGKLRPEAVVEAATAPESPLHSLFEWNDTDAARLYRIDQARSIIRAFVLEVSDKGEMLEAPRYVRDVDAEARESRYVDVTTIPRKSQEARATLANEVDRAFAILQRVRAVAASLGISINLSAMTEGLDDLKNRLIGPQSGKLMGAIAKQERATSSRSRRT